MLTNSDTPHVVPVAINATLPEKNVFIAPPAPSADAAPALELTPAFLDAVAAELTKAGAVAPIWLRCGGENVVLIRDHVHAGMNLHDHRRGKRNRYGWTRHASEDQARFFFACAPGSVVPVDDLDDIAAKNIYIAEGSRTNG